MVMKFTPYGDNLHETSCKCGKLRKIISVLQHPESKLLFVSVVV